MPLGALYKLRYTVQFTDSDSATGRYRQSDPLGQAAGFNTYAYVNGNPLSYVDSLGLEIGHAYADIYHMDGGRPLNEPVSLRTPDYITFQKDAYVFSASATYTVYGDIFLGKGANRAYPNPVSRGVSISNGWMRNMCGSDHPSRTQLNDFLQGYSGGVGGYWGAGGSYSVNPSGQAFNLGVGFGGFGASPAMVNSYQGNIFGDPR